MPSIFISSTEDKRINPHRKDRDKTLNSGAIGEINEASMEVAAIPPDLWVQMKQGKKKKKKNFVKDKEGIEWAKKCRWEYRELYMGEMNNIFLPNYKGILSLIDYTENTENIGAAFHF